MNTTNEHAGSPDPFEEILRRRLGPTSLEGPPPHLRQAILARVAALPAPEARFRLRPAVVASALTAGFLALVLGWLLTGPAGGLLHAGGSLTATLSEGPWQGGLGTFTQGGWWDLVRSPVVMAVLPLLLLPLLYLLVEER